MRRGIGIVAAFALVCMALPARAWDSMCVRAEGLVDFSSEAGTPVCVPIYERQPRFLARGVFDFCSSGGYETAQGVYGGEHALITARILHELGLGAYAETEERELAVWAQDASFDHGASRYPYLTPAPFAGDAPLRRHERSYTVAGFSELPDFGSSLGDWASGYEHCAIRGVARADAAEVQACHEFTEVLGPVNSNHFVPQARVVFEHYRELALDVLEECKRLEDRIDGWDHADRSRVLADEVLAECEIEGMTLIAIGLHYFEDMFSVGHMWERWGTPSLPAENRLGDAISVAALSGIIHGWRTLVEPLLLDYGADEGGALLGRIAQDPLSAPVDAFASTYRFEGATYQGVGDDYVLPCLQTYMSPTLSTLHGTHTAGSVVEHDELYAAQRRCVTSAILEAYRAGPMLQGEPTVPAFMQGVAPAHHLSEACSSRRATNKAMYRALGLGSFSVSPAHLALLDITVGKIGGLAGQVVLNVPSVRRWRNLVTSLSGALYVNALFDPQGTSSAALDFGPLLAEAFGFEKNSAYLAESVPPQADKGPVSSWSADAAGSACDSDAACDGRLVCNRASAQCEEPEAATLRAFNRAHASYWCEHTTREDLDRMREQCARDGERCELCVELARRHVRNACDDETWQALPEAERVDALCTATELASAEPAQILYAGLLEHCQGGGLRDADAAARRWCETEDLTTIERPDPGVPAPRLGATSPGGLTPPAAPGETVTLEVRYRDATLVPLAGRTMRFVRYLDASFEACVGPLDGVAKTTDADGRARFDVSTSAGQPETVYVRACPSEDASAPCNPCDPTTLTFAVTTRAGRYLTVVAGDGQIGAPGAVLPIALTVAVSPPVPDGTMIRFATPDVGLPSAERTRLDGSTTLFEIDKPTTGSRAEVRLTLPKREGNVFVTATGVDPALFPDAAAGAVELRVEARATPVLASVRFAYYQNSPIGPMEVLMKVVRDGITTEHTIAVAEDLAGVNVLDVAPVGTAVTIRLLGVNALGVGFESAPIPIASLLERHDLGSVFMTADQGHVRLRTFPPTTGAPVSDWTMMLFDSWAPWPPAVIPEAPETIKLGVDEGFNVPFQDFVMNDGTPWPRRHLDMYFYAPGNQGRAVAWVAVVSHDKYLWDADVRLGAASHPPPSEALVSAYLRMADLPATIVGAPLKVYDPDGNVVFDYPADWTAGGPFWFPTPPSDPTIVTGGYDLGEGFVVFAANGVEFPVSPHGLLFFVFDPPLADYNQLQRSYCSHDRGNVERILVATPASCVTNDDCRPTDGHMTGICEAQRCHDFNYPEINSRDALCSNSGGPVSIGPCGDDFSCGPELRCVAEACLP